MLIVQSKFGTMLVQHLSILVFLYVLCVKQFQGHIHCDSLSSNIVVAQVLTIAPWDSSTGAISPCDI